jgi:regulatory protein
MGTFRRKRPGDPWALTERQGAASKSKDTEAARKAAVALLARRDFASGELRQKLRSQGFEAAVIEGLVAALTEERSLDDARYAENYVAYHAGRGHGPVRIATDLRALGMSATLIEVALATGPDWRALAHEVRARKFGAESPEEWTEKTRQARFLQYRGFSSDHIRAATGADFDPDS